MTRRRGVLRSRPRFDPRPGNRIRHHAAHRLRQPSGQRRNRRKQPSTSMPARSRPARRPCDSPASVRTVGSAGAADHRPTEGDDWGTGPQRRQGQGRRDRRPPSRLAEFTVWCDYTGMVSSWSRFAKSEQIATHVKTPIPMLQPTGRRRSIDEPEAGAATSPLPQTSFLDELKRALEDRRLLLAQGGELSRPCVSLGEGCHIARRTGSMAAPWSVARRT